MILIFDNHSQKEAKAFKKLLWMQLKKKTRHFACIQETTSHRGTRLGSAIIHENQNSRYDSPHQKSTSDESLGSCTRVGPPLNHSTPVANLNVNLADKVKVNLTDHSHTCSVRQHRRNTQCKKQIGHGKNRSLRHDTMTSWKRTHRSSYCTSNLTSSSEISSLPKSMFDHTDSSLDINDYRVREQIGIFKGKADRSIQRRAKAVVANQCRVTKPHCPCSQKQVDQCGSCGVGSAINSDRTSQEKTPDALTCSRPSHDSNVGRIGIVTRYPRMGKRVYNRGINIKRTRNDTYIVPEIDSYLIKRMRKINKLVSKARVARGQCSDISSDWSVYTDLQQPSELSGKESISYMI